MFDQAKLDEIARYNEKVVEKRFKKMGFSVNRLDVQGPRKRPEFLVSDTYGPFLVCEVKTIFSAGFLKERAAHISTEDPALIGTGVFGKEVSFERIDEDLREAVQKYRELLEDRPELARTPLVVAFFFDPFADVFDFYPSRMEEFPEVSAILKIEEAPAIRRMAEQMSLEELREHIDSGSMKGFPPPNKEFRVLENELADNPLPRHFLNLCVT